MTTGCRNVFVLLALLVPLGLSSCAGAPAPGGTDAINREYFTSAGDLKEKVELLIPGMPEEEVLKTLGVKVTQLTQLDRNGIRKALFGSDSALPGTPEQQLETQTFLQGAYGYKLDYRDVKRKHGFSSPIRIHTDEHGFSYTVTMVFHTGRLLEKPVLSGGVVNDDSSQTLFDFLNPGTAIGFIH